MRTRLNAAATILKPPPPVKPPPQLPQEGVYQRKDGTRVLVVEVPFPPRSQSNNHRPAHWSEYNSDRTMLRTLTAFRVRQVCKRGGVPAFPAAIMELLALFPDGRNMLDPDGLVGMNKGNQDGLVEAGVIPNDDPAHLGLGPVRIRIARGLVRERKLYLIVRERRTVFGLVYRPEEVEDWLS